MRFYAPAACLLLCTGRAYRVTLPADDKLEAESAADATRAPPRRACVGSMVLKVGNCTPEIVTDEEGHRHEVKQYCYSESATDAGAKASWGYEGTCYIPNKYPCDNTPQCRPGTFCVPKQAASTLPYACGEPNFLIELLPEGAERIARLVQTMARKAIDGDPKRAGVLSPFADLVLMRQMLVEVKESFATTELQTNNETSRSGATFAYSGDGRFIAKLIRDYEYDAMVEHLMHRFPQHGELDNVDCAIIGGESGADAGDNCWAAAALAHTALNLPLLAFRHRDQSWVVVPEVSKLRAYARKTTAGSQFVMPRYFDVKPAWAHSNQREAFFQNIVGLQFAPDALGAPAQVQEQWTSLSAMLRRDIAFLGDPGGGPPFVDYSFLFEVYLYPHSVTDPGPGCVVSPSCFDDNDSADPMTRGPAWHTQQRTSCSVVCVTIIDYFLAYDSYAKMMESKIIYSKWDNYAGKASELLRCVGHLSRFGSWDEDVLEEERPSWEESRVLFPGSKAPLATWERRFPNTTRVWLARIEPGDDDLMPPCAAYLEMACRSSVRLHAVYRTDRPGDLANIPGVSLNWLINPSELPGVKLCDYRVSSARAEDCKAHLALDCQASTWGA